MPGPNNFEIRPLTPSYLSWNRFTVFMRTCGGYQSPFPYESLPTSLEEQYISNISVIWSMQDNPTWAIWEYYKNHAFHIRFRGLTEIEENAELLLLIYLESHSSSVNDTKVEVYQGATRIDPPTGESFWLIRNGFETIPLILLCPRNSSFVDIIIRPITRFPVGLTKVYGEILP